MGRGVQAWGVTGRLHLRSLGRCAAAGCTASSTQVSELQQAEAASRAAAKAESVAAASSGRQLGQAQRQQAAEVAKAAAEVARLREAVRCTRGRRGGGEMQMARGVVLHAPNEAAWEQAHDSISWACVADPLLHILLP